MEAHFHQLKRKENRVKAELDEQYSLGMIQKVKL